MAARPAVLVQSDGWRSYCASSARREAFSSAWPSALSPSARASCSAPTNWLAMAGAAVGRCVLRQCATHGGDQASHSLGSGLAYLGSLARHLRNQRCHRATGFDVAEMSIGQVAFHKGTQGTGAACLAHGGALSDTISTVAACTREGFSQQGIAGAEVGVEAAMRQPGFFHDVGDAHAVESTPADRPRSGRDDAFVAEFLAAGRAVHSQNCSSRI